MSEIVFGVEKIADIKEELKPLLVLHFAEVENHLDIPLDVDFETYERLNDLQSLICFTARKNNKLIGYNSFFISKSMHSKNSLQAFQDAVYIHKDYRGFGRSFFKYSDGVLKNNNVQVCYHSVKAHKNYGKMLEEIGYSIEDYIYMKRLDKWGVSNG